MRRHSLPYSPTNWLISSCGTLWVMDTWQGSLPRFPIWKFILASASISLLDRKPMPRRRRWNCFRIHPIAANLRVQASFSRLSPRTLQQLPNLLHAHFSNDFGSGHLTCVPTSAHSPNHAMLIGLDQISALPLGSRIVVDPWSDRIEMLGANPCARCRQRRRCRLRCLPSFLFSSG